MFFEQSQRLFAFVLYVMVGSLLISGKHFYQVGRIGTLKVVKSHHCSLQFMYQGRKVGGHVFVC